MKKASSEMIGFLRDLLIVAIVLVLVFLPVSSKLLSIFFSNPCPEVDRTVSSMANTIDEYNDFKEISNNLNILFPITKSSSWKDFFNSDEDVGFEIYFQYQKENKYGLCYQCSESDFKKCYDLDNINVLKDDEMCEDKCPLNLDISTGDILLLNLSFSKQNNNMEIALS